jgi:carbamoylphosphate synthase large subunit
VAYDISNYSVKITAVAGADLSSSQYKFVKMSADNTVVLCSAATDKPIGVLQNDPKSGQEAEILISGGTKVNAGATLTAGSVIGTSATGTAVALTVGTDTTKYVVGTVVAGGASGEIITAVISASNAGRAA